MRRSVRNDYLLDPIQRHRLADIQNEQLRKLREAVADRLELDARRVSSYPNRVCVMLINPRSRLADNRHDLVRLLAAHNIKDKAPVAPRTPER